jgi:predicted nucleic acid-binding protein
MFITRRPGRGSMPNRRSHALFATAHHAQIVTFDQGFNQFAGLDLFVLS